MEVQKNLAIAGVGGVDGTLQEPQPRVQICLGSPNVLDDRMPTPSRQLLDDQMLSKLLSDAQAEV